MAYHVSSDNHRMAERMKWGYICDIHRSIFIWYREVAVSWGDMMRAIRGAVGMEGDGKDSRCERN